MVCYVVLCYRTLFHVVSCYIMFHDTLLYVLSCHALLCHIMPSYTMFLWWYTMVIVLHRAMRYCIISRVHLALLLHTKLHHCLVLMVTHVMSCCTSLCEIAMFYLKLYSRSRCCIILYPIIADTAHFRTWCSNILYHVAIGFMLSFHGPSEYIAFYRFLPFHIMFLRFTSSYVLPLSCDIIWFHSSPYYVWWYVTCGIELNSL